jgi:hypothetical protein
MVIAGRMTVVRGGSFNGGGFECHLHVIPVRSVSRILPGGHSFIRETSRSGKESLISFGATKVLLVLSFRGLTGGIRLFGLVRRFSV